MKVSKRQFAKKEVHYLDHVVRVGVVNVNAHDRRPREMSNLSWLGRLYLVFCSWVCHNGNTFIRSHSKGKLEQVAWTAECEAAFKALKRVLVSAPVLQIADLSKSYTLQTDASGQGLGAVLSQVGADGEDHPIVGTTGIPYVSVQDLICCPDRSPTTAQDEVQHCTPDKVGSVLTALLLLAGL